MLHEPLDSDVTGHIHWPGGRRHTAGPADCPVSPGTYSQITKKPNTGSVGLLVLANLGLFPPLLEDFLLFLGQGKTEFLAGADVTCTS